MLGRLDDGTNESLTKRLMFIINPNFQAYYSWTRIVAVISADCVRGHSKGRVGGQY